MLVDYYCFRITDYFTLLLIRPTSMATVYTWWALGIHSIIGLFWTQNILNWVKQKKTKQKKHQKVYQTSKKKSVNSRWSESKTVH